MITRSRFLKLGIPVFFLYLAIAACGFSSSNSDTGNPSNLPNSGQELDPIAANGPGFGRSDPIPLGTQISIPGWDVEVREFLRGADALKVINTADWQAEPLPEDQEYALAKVFIRNTALDESPHSLGISELFITGDQYLAHGDTMDGWPQPEFLFEDMYTAETVEGWVDAVVPKNEQNLELVLDVENEDNRYTRFFTLDKAASISLPEEFSKMHPNDLGSSMESPAGIGDVVITPDWEVTLLESIKGKNAEKILTKDNPNYQVPESGTERVLLKVHLKYLSQEDIPAWIGSDQFRALDSSGYSVQGNWIYTPQDREWIGNTVLPGADLEGWVAVTVPEVAGDALISFNPDINTPGSSDQDLRYFQLN